MAKSNCSFAQIPAPLRSLRQWLPWTYDGQRRKMPIDPATARAAHWSNPAILVSFAQALAYQEQHNLAGVGFFFQPTDPFIGIDLDSCRWPNGRLTSWAQEIVDLVGSYCEVSPSGCGVKIIALGQRPAWANKKAPQQMVAGLKQTSSKAVEIAMCDCRGYFALTGHVYKDLDAVQRRQRAINKLCRRFWPNPILPTRPPPCACKSVTLSKGQRSELDERLARADAAEPRDEIGGQSRYDFALVCWLLREGIDPESVWPLICDRSKFRRRGRPYFDTTVASARRNLGLR